MEIRENHQQILQECKDYICSSSQTFIEFKKKELKDVLSDIISQEEGEKHLKAYNLKTQQHMKLPQKEKMLLNMIDKDIPKNADLNFLPSYEDDRISFKHFTPSQTYYVHTNKVPFKKEIQNIIKELIMPDIDKEFEKSENHFLIKYIQTEKRLRDAVTIAISGFIHNLRKEEKYRNIEELTTQTRQIRINSDKLEETVSEKSIINEKTETENIILSKMMQTIKRGKSGNIQNIIQKIQTNKNENIKILIFQIRQQNKKLEEVMKTTDIENDEDIKILATEAKDFNDTMEVLLQKIKDEDKDHSVELCREISSDDNKLIQQIFEEMNIKVHRNNRHMLRLVKKIRGDGYGIKGLIGELKGNQTTANQIIEKAGLNIKSLISKLNNVHLKYRNNVHMKESNNPNKKRRKKVFIDRSGHISTNPYQETMQIFKEDAFTSIITDAHCQKYHDIIARNFINSVHNYIEFGIEERAIKIQEYAQKGHILYQMTKAENLEKILTSKKESYAPLIEIQSNKDLYENNKINPREILKLIYKDEVEKGFFDDAEGILFHPNMVLIYKKSVIHPLPNNQRMKEFFYDKNLNTNKAVTDIKQDREAQEKHKEYFRKIVFETINEFLQDFHDETSRDAYKQRIEQTYKMKITNTYSNMKVDSPGLELNGENISNQIKTYIEQLIGAFPTIFPKYISELNLTYRNAYKGKTIDIDNKRVAMFHIIEKRKKNIEEIERDIVNEKDTEFTIDNEELKIFEKYPNDYLIIFIERGLGKIYKQVVKNDDTFKNAISPNDMYNARSYFQKQNAYKNDESILINFFIKYGVKYLKKNHNGMPYKVKTYLDSILGEKKQIE